MFLLHVVLVMTVGSLVAVSSQQNGDLDKPSCKIKTTKEGTKYVLCTFPLNVAENKRDFYLQIVTPDKTNPELALACQWKDKTETPECHGIPGFQLMNEISNKIRIQLPPEYAKFEFKCGLTRNSSDGPNQTSKICSDTENDVQHGNWGVWQTEGSCRGTCGHGVQMMTRSCDNPAPTKCGEHCAGRDYDLQPCNLTPCKGFSLFETALIAGTTGLVIIIIALTIIVICFWRCHCHRRRDYRTKEPLSGSVQTKMTCGQQADVCKQFVTETDEEGADGDGNVS